MKIVSLRPGVNASGHLILSVDVSKKYLDCYIRFSDSYRRILNTSTAVRAHLDELFQFTEKEDLSGILVACEPSGGYERTLLETSRVFGCQCVYVSGEQVAQLRKIESLDTGKTDVKDPRVIELAVSLGKTLRYRRLPPLYEELRLLVGAYDADQFVRSQTKQRIITTSLGLFPGYDLGKNRFFSRTGRAVIDTYHLDPSSIVRGGRKRFEHTMRRSIPGVHAKTLDKIYAQAEAAPRRGPGTVSVLSARIADLLADVSRLDARMNRLRTEIEARGAILQESGQLGRLQHISGLTLFNLARTAGEAGPFTDFHSARVLLRYAGINLRERTSGTYKGKTRISKKGRATLRKTLAQTTFPLLQRDRLYGAYYARKREGGMSAQKAKTAVMRKFLVMLYAISLSGALFSEHRFTHPAQTKAGHISLQMVC